MGDGDGHRSLACCNPQDHKESDMTGQLNNKTWTRSICKDSRDREDGEAIGMEGSR